MSAVGNEDSSLGRNRLATLLESVVYYIREGGAAQPFFIRFLGRESSL